MAWQVDIDLAGQSGEVTPLGDLVAHQTGAGCLCGPADRPVPLPDGTVCWLLVHHSLDGRETTEPPHREEP